jgi:CTP:molybdopterin cytidylyltransferase MocA
VLGYEADRVVPLLSTENVEPIVHVAWAHDDAGVLRTGAAATLRGVAAAIVADVARPRPAAACERLLDAHFSSVAAISRPSHGGQPGWPVIVDEHVLAELRNVSDATGGLEALLARHAGETQDVPFDDPVVVLEIDSRDTYERALEALR